MKAITTKANQVSLKELDITILESYVLSNRWNHECLSQEGFEGMHFSQFHPTPCFAVSMSFLYVQPHPA
jgi:hypothetical protein